MIPKGSLDLHKEMKSANKCDYIDKYKDNFWLKSPKNYQLFKVK